MSTSAVDRLINRGRNEAIERLRQLLPVGRRVFTILRSITRSRMTREIDVLFWDDTSKAPVIFSWLAGQALDYDLSKHNAVVVRGTGMDMEFYLVSQIATLLHGDGHAFAHGSL